MLRLFGESKCNKNQPEFDSRRSNSVLIDGCDVLFRFTIRRVLFHVHSVKKSVKHKNVKDN